MYETYDEEILTVPRGIAYPRLGVVGGNSRR